MPDDRLAEGDVTEVELLREAVRRLATALQSHRVDMHSPSDRPCPTCGPSAKVLRAVGVKPFVEYGGMDRQAALDDASRAALSDAGRELFRRATQTGRRHPLTATNHPAHTATGGRNPARTDTTRAA